MKERNTVQGEAAKKGLEARARGATGAAWAGTVGARTEGLNSTGFEAVGSGAAANMGTALTGLGQSAEEMT